MRITDFVTDSCSKHNERTILNDEKKHRIAGLEFDLETQALQIYGFRFFTREQKKIAICTAIRELIEPIFYTTRLITRLAFSIIYIIL